jgi:hypothetical protein
MAANMRVGVAGAGFIGAVHARAYLQMPGAELVGVADPIGEKQSGAIGRPLTALDARRGWPHLRRAGSRGLPGGAWDVGGDWVTNNCKLRTNYKHSSFVNRHATWSIAL